MTLTSDSIEEKQLDMCRGNIIFCHVDFFCLQGKKRKIRKRSIFRSRQTASDDVLSCSSRHRCKAVEHARSQFFSRISESSGKIEHPSKILTK